MFHNKDAEYTHTLCYTKRALRYLGSEPSQLGYSLFDLVYNWLNKSSVEGRKKQRRPNFIKQKINIGINDEGN